MTTPWRNAVWWPDPDDETGQRACQAHDCLEGRVASKLPKPRWKIEGDEVKPSLHCLKCALHVQLTAAFRGEPEELKP